MPKTRRPLAGALGAWTIMALGISPATAHAAALQTIALQTIALQMGATSAAAASGTRIADPPPRFRFYDVDRRERWLQRTLGQLEGSPGFSRQRADADLGRLDDIRRDEARRRARHGHLSRADLRLINHRLDRLARGAGL